MSGTAYQIMCYKSLGKGVNTAFSQAYELTRMHLNDTESDHVCNVLIQLLKSEMKEFSAIELFIHNLDSKEVGNNLTPFLMIDELSRDFFSAISYRVTNLTFETAHPKFMISRSR